MKEGEKAPPHNGEIKTKEQVLDFLPFCSLSLFSSAHKKWREGEQTVARLLYMRKKEGGIPPLHCRSFLDQKAGEQPETNRCLLLSNSGSGLIVTGKN